MNYIIFNMRFIPMIITDKLLLIYLLFCLDFQILYKNFIVY